MKTQGEGGHSVDHGNVALHRERTSLLSREPLLRALSSFLCQAGG